MQSKQEDLLNVSEFAELCNVTTETLRHYDRKGLISPDYINPDTRYRYYRLDTYKCIKVITALRNLNFSITEIKKLFDSWNSGSWSYEYFLDYLKNNISELTKEISILEKRRENAIGCLNSFLNYEIFNRCEEIVEKNIDGFTALCKKEYEKIDNTNQLIYAISNFEKMLENLKEINSYIFADYRYFGLVRNYLNLKDRSNMETRLGIILNKEINKELPNTEIVKFPSQKCVCLLHNGRAFDTLNSIDRMLKYISDNRYKIIGDIRLQALAGHAIIGPCINMYYEIQIPIE